jgi:formylglycine-generating enzyme required for sulfatase activity
MSGGDIYHTHEVEMNNQLSGDPNPTNLSVKALPVFENTDDLAAFTKKLRVLCFRTTVDAAKSAGISHTNFVRYEAEGAEPPLGYLAWIAHTIESQVDPQDRADCQTHLLHEINRALLQHDPTKARFTTWQSLEQAMRQWPAKRMRKQPPQLSDDSAAKPDISESGNTTLPPQEGGMFLPHRLRKLTRYWSGNTMRPIILIGSMLGILALTLTVVYEYRGRYSSNVTPVLAYEEALIPAGPFIQGSTQDQINYFGQLCEEAKGHLPYLCDATFFEDELPARQVILSSYFIDQHEVTNNDFQRFVTANHHITTAERVEHSWVFLLGTTTVTDTQGADWQHPEGPLSNISGQGSYPVVHVSYADAAAYCKWVHKRLPTEAEWEKAARGPNGQLFPWGDKWDNTKGNYVVVVPDGSDYTRGLQPVGSYPQGRSPYGVDDLLGNAFEWVADWYDPDYYRNNPPERNPQGPPKSPKEQHSRRGGGWATRAGFLHAAWRIDRPERTSNDLGFRCARDP